MGKKDDLIKEAEGLGIELDASETISDLEAKIAAHEADDETHMDAAVVPIGSAAWAIAELAAGNRVMREAWVDNRHFDPAHIRAGIKLSHDDLTATDWTTI